MTVQKLLLSFGVQNLLSISKEPLTLNVSFRLQIFQFPSILPVPSKGKCALHRVYIHLQ